MSADREQEEPTRALLMGWGNTCASAARVIHPDGHQAARRALTAAANDRFIARGLGRAYGDAAQNAGGVVAETNRLAAIESIDIAAGVVRVGAGVSLDTLTSCLLPMGLFTPVSPGTRQVTVGGALAADIHGKNHHVAGTFGSHVRSIRVLTGQGEIDEYTPTDTPEEFWATVGGMGLTGMILDATVEMTKVESSQLVVDTDRIRNVDDLMAVMAAEDANYPYSVAWIDLMGRGAHLGRSVLTRGRFATVDDLVAGKDAFSLPRGSVISAPPLVPSGLLNRWSIQVFNSLWFHRAPRCRREEIQSISTFFHPLDLVRGWNRLYGAKGFLQWQCVVPAGAERELVGIIEQLSQARCTSFLAVLKRFGPANPGPLSFPIEGWTLSLDIPAGMASLGVLLDELDEQVVSVGGRLYLAKDSRMRPEILEASYPRLDEWREIRERLDPHGRFRSDLARRLSLVD